jgi:hypothetical protein
MTNAKKSGFELAFQPAILTGCAFALAGVLAVFYPLAMVLLYASILPVVLIPLWVGRDVAAPIDRIKAVDAERRAMRTVPPRAAMPLKRAA